MWLVVGRDNDVTMPETVPHRVRLRVNYGRFSTELATGWLMDLVRIDRARTRHTRAIRRCLVPVHLESTPHTREANVWIWI